MSVETRASDPRDNAGAHDFLGEALPLDHEDCPAHGVPVGVCDCGYPPRPANVPRWL